MFRPVASLACALLVTGAVASQANAARLFFATQGWVGPEQALTTGVPVVGNPSVTIDAGQNVNLYLWAEMKVGDAISGLSITIRSSQAGLLAAQAFSLEQVYTADLDQYRWQVNRIDENGDPLPNPNYSLGINNGTLNPAGDVTALVAGIKGVGVNTGNDPAPGIAYSSTDDPTRKTTPNNPTVTRSFYLGQLTLTGLTEGVAELKFEVGSGTISGASLAGDLFFGTGDAAISGDGATVGSTSANADATITVNAIPEPASLGLLAIGGLMMIARRRRA